MRTACVLLLGLVGGSLGVGGCGASRSGAVGGEEPDQTEERRVTVEVSNENFYDATIYAVYGSGQRIRLGTVSGNSVETFTFRWNPLNVFFYINLIGSGDASTQSEGVNPGDLLLLRVTSDLHAVLRR